MLEFETASGGWMEPWEARRRPKKLAFPTLAEAIGYAEWHGYDYRIEPPLRRSITAMRRRRGERQLPRSWLRRLRSNARNGDIYHG